MKRLFSIFLFITCSTAAFAQEQSGGLKMLINQSFTWFPAFKELGQAVDVEQQRIELAKSNGLPSVQATGSYNYLHPVSEITIPGGDQPLQFQIMPNNNYKAMLNASYTLWDFGVVKANVERAKAGLQYAKDNVQYNQNQMAFQVANIYYQIAYLKAAISIQDSVLQFLGSNKKDTEIKYKNGDALKYDVLSIQSSIDQENNRKIDLQKSLDKQYALMEYTTGTRISDSPADFNLPVDGITGSQDEALENAQRSNPEFRLLNDRIAQAEAELAVSKTGGKPSLTVGAGTGYATGYTPEIDKFRYNYTAGVTLNIPIYQGGKARKQVSLARSQSAQTKYAQETLNNTFRKNIEQALIDINSNRSSLVNAQAQIKEAKEAQKFAQSRFRNGTGTNLELVNASTNVQRAELTKLQYEYQLCVAQIEIARLTGLKYW